MSGMFLHFLLVAILANRACGHAYMSDPPSRNLLKHRSNEENCPHCLQAGGPGAVIARGRGIWPTINDPGSHGLCGDPRQLSPEPASIAEMQYMEASAPQRTYVAGSTVEFTVFISTHHQGHFEYRICDKVLDKTLASAEVGQQCLNAHLLHRAPVSASCGDSFMGDCQPVNENYPERWYLPPPSADGDVYVMRYIIPEDLACEHCTMQWYWVTGNSCAYDEDYFIFDPGFKFFQGYDSISSWAKCSNTCCGVTGNPGFGEEFWNCADVKVIGTTTTSTTVTPVLTTTPLRTEAPTTPTATEAPSSTTTAEAPTSVTTTTETPAPTSTPARQAEIQSGDTIFLKTHSGQGKMLHVEGTSVQAKWEDLGGWQAIVIEKNGGGGIQSGDTVFLMGHTGAQIDVQGEAVQARWGEKGGWQSLTVEKADGAGAILPGDVVCFKAHTGKHIDVEDTTVRARWTDRCGFWQGMRVERKDQGVAVGVNSGDDVYLVAHTGNLIDVQGDSVQARWKESGLWQKLRIENAAGGGIFSGDSIFLAAHTSKMLDVQSTVVQARYTDQGGWQKFVIQNVGGGAIITGETIYLKAHTGKFVDVEGVAVSARWTDQGLWQSFSLEKHNRRVLQQLTIQAFTNPNETEDGQVGLALGVAVGLLSAACMVPLMIVFAVRKRYNWQLCAKLMNRESPTPDLHNFDSKVHPSPDRDDSGSD